KEKEDEKKKKEKEDEKKKKEKEDEKKNEQSPTPSENVDDKPSPTPSENVDDKPSPTPSENVDDKQNLISHTKRSANDNAPFFGTDSFGNRYIDNGFTFNDFITDVEDFKTLMPLQTIQVGEPNTAVLKIYNHKGISTLEHVELVFGLDQKQSDGLNTNSIVWEQNFKGIQSVSTEDPDNLLMDVNAVGETDDKVMSITFTFAFREPMEKSKIGVVVWDHDRNSRTAYFNDGIEVVGESLNPPEIITILDSKGYPVKITVTGKNTGVDEEGNIWTHNSPWTKQIQSVEDQLTHENLDTVSSHGFDRMNSMFSSYKNVQAQEAQKKLMEILGGHNISNFSD
ncbi:MAG: hypothetical protein WD018_08215, partial [Nitrosopumilaceae archaeon]